MQSAGKPLQKTGSRPANLLFRAGMVALVNVRRMIPRTDAVLADPRLAGAEQRLGRPLVLAAVRRAQERARAGLASAAVSLPESIAARLRAGDSGSRGGWIGGAGPCR